MAQAAAAMVHWLLQLPIGSTIGDKHSEQWFEYGSFGQTIMYPEHTIERDTAISVFEELSNMLKRNGPQEVSFKVWQNGRQRRLLALIDAKWRDSNDAARNKTHNEVDLGSSRRLKSVLLARSI